MEELPPTYEDSIRLVKVEGRIYRKAIQASQTNPSSSFQKGRVDQWSEYEDDEDGRKCSLNSSSTSTTSTTSNSSIRGDRESNEDSTIVGDKSGGFETRLHVPSAFHKFLIGKQGSTRNQIQKDTGATLQIPPPTATTNNDFITIKGKTAAIVSSAKARVEIVLQTALERSDYTHFVCFPLNDLTLQQKVKNFMEEVNNSEDRSTWKGYDPSIAISPLKLHLTICMLKLYSKETIEAASRLLQELSKRIYDAAATRTLLVGLKGLEIMNDDPSAVDVLYLKVQDPDGRVSKVAQLVLEHFHNAGLVSDNEFEKGVKLHATLFNTRYRYQAQTQTQSQSQGQTSHQKREEFDARSLLRKWSQVDFGEVRLSSVQLSQRSTDSKTGFYTCQTTVSLP